MILRFGRDEDFNVGILHGRTHVIHQRNYDCVLAFLPFILAFQGNVIAVNFHFHRMLIISFAGKGRRRIR